MPTPETPTERAAVVMLLIADGVELSVKEIVALANYDSEQGAWHLMWGIARVTPVEYHNHRWRRLPRR